MIKKIINNELSKSKIDNINSVKNPLLLLSETELRDLCRHSIDSLEQWSRRLINEKFIEDFGDNYVDAIIDDKPLIKSSLKKSVSDRMEEDIGRFPRWIDATVLDDIKYFYCREDLYKKYFKKILEPFYSNSKNVSNVMDCLIGIRNKLSHGNIISIHEAEQAICYSNDIINQLQLYYQREGKNKEYNIPIFMRIKDSLGNDIIREHTNWYPWEVFTDSSLTKLKNPIILRSGDLYKIWVEVNGSFPESDYEISWSYECGKKKKNGKGNTIDISFDDDDVSYHFVIYFYLKTHNTWHRRAMFNNDDEIKISFSSILPPISSMY